MNTFSFDYNGQNSREYDLAIGSISMNDSIPLAMSREILAGSINRYRSNPNHMGTQWSDVLEFELAFVKSPCDNPNAEDAVFTEDEINNIDAWLTSPDYPLLLKMYDNDYGAFTKYDYFGLFRDIQPQIIGGEIIGLTCVFRTNSPFAWTKMITKEFECSGTTNVNITTNTAERNREIYPLIHIKPENTNPGEDMEITIKNKTDGNRSLTITIPKLDTYIDCQYSRVYYNENVVSMEDMGIGDLNYIYWPRLYFGKNELEITGDATISFSWREPRKVGAY